MILLKAENNEANNMDTNLYLPKRYYASLNKEVHIIQLTRLNYERTKRDIRFSISYGEQEVATDWIEIPLKGETFIDELVKTVPQVLDNLPIIETTSQHSSSTLMCSSYLLKNGKLIKTYMPMSITGRKFLKLYESKNRIQISDGEHVYNMKAADVVAILEV